MGVERTSDLWWKNEVTYCLDVETYLDWDDDGIGDFVGLTERLDYLQGMGITCIWLMPFYASPDRDDGYDVSDHVAVDPRLGTIGDFVELMRTARDRGIRVLVDLVVNHTSDQHPWFQDARSSRDSRHRHWYVWSDTPDDDGRPLVFPGEEDSVWTFDEVAGQWYHHRFYAHQPDLNIANAEVRREIGKIVGYWLALGVDGFRVDAVPYLLAGSTEWEAAHTTPHDWMRELRSFIGRRRGEAVLMGEVDRPATEVATYFGTQGGELQMQLNFVVMQAAWLSFARADATPLATAISSLPALPPGCQWANFLRNHDELTLDLLSPDERADVFAAFGPDPDMQIYGRGLRRRLPTMLGGDQRRIRLAYSLLLALPGTPVLLYGEEIGMGENLASAGRDAVRTPMQWSDEENGGFSVAPAERLPEPMAVGEYAPKHVNVAAQRRDPDSLLNWFERMIRRRKETPEIGFGDCTVLDGGASAVLVHRLDWDGRAVIFVHNLSPAAQHVDVALVDLDDADTMIDLLGGDHLPVGDDHRLVTDVEPYGVRWFRAGRPGQRQVP
jgi:maltose alpha-D-glucosyltransferase/alpha-amylase